MAVWNVVRSSILSRTYRLDPEYYQSYYLELLEQVRDAGAQQLSDAADVVERRFRPQPGCTFEYIEISRVSTTLGTYESVRLLDNEAPSRAQYLVPKGTVLLSTVRPNRSAVALVLNPSPRTVCSSGFIVLKPRQVNPEYLFAFLKTKCATELLVRETTATMYPAVAKEDVLSLPFLQPDSSFHERVTNLIRKAHLELERAERLYSQAQSLLLSELGLDKIDLSPSLFYERDFSEVQQFSRLDAEFFQPKYYALIDAIRKTGKDRKLGEIVTHCERGLQPEYDDEGDVVVVNTKHMGAQFLSDDFERCSDESWKTQKRARLKQYDVLFYSTGAYIGRTNIWLKKDKAVGSNHVTIIRPNDECNPIYLALFLNSQAGLMQADRFAHGSAQREVYPDDIKSYTIWLPPKEIQEKYARIVLEAYTARQESKRLIDEAVRLVEEAIIGKGQ